MSEMPSDETAAPPSPVVPTAEERDLASILLGVYFVALIVVVVALLVVPVVL
jgi:hypothetical protein